MTPVWDWTGKVALVTGGASGIGAATALAFAERGGDVIVADVDGDGGGAVAARAREHGVRAEFVECSVAAEDSVRQLLEVVRERFGRLDFAVNNAGVEQRRAGVTECTEDNWDRTIDTNLKGVWLSMKYEIPLFGPDGGGIVNMSSMVGLVGVPGAPAYVASKHGIIGLTKSAALEVADSGIRVNAVCPGNIRTPMVERVLAREPAKETEYTANTPLRRIGTPEEVANAVLWLCAPEAGFVTGHALSVDGGVVAK
ncbi:glucose 1-dehydrogenase [Sciscionella marina]|uniref:glucose 1-dehydrogenase n=1 Tax=Sciscionella marina TaxID=508770 RepID=UPI000360A5A9|nr:glucose 1-dehydrogenase [Sciscionella marina]